MEQTRSSLVLAGHYLEVDQPQRALESLDAIAQPDLEDPLLWELRTQALVDLERYASAVGSAQDGLRVEPDSITLLDLLSVAQAGLGRLEEAEAAILEAIRLVPEHPILLCRYAEILARGGELAKAGRVLAEAERIDPDHEAVIRCRIAHAYLRGDDRAAKRESRRLLSEIDPEDPVGHAMLGVQAASRGNVRAASRHFDAVAQHDLRDRTAVAVAREARIETHPLFWPVLPIQRYGAAKIWLGAIAIFGLLRATGQDVLLVVAAIAYVAFCAYSWIVPPLARRWFARGSR